MVLQKRFQANVSDLIAVLGWSRAELAKRAGVSQRSVETALTDGEPTLLVVEQFAKALGVTPERLLRENSVETTVAADNVAVMEDSLTIAEAAEIARLSVQELSRKCREGLIPATQRGSVWWISRQAMDAFLKNRPRRGRPSRRENSCNKT